MTKRIVIVTNTITFILKGTIYVCGVLARVVAVVITGGSYGSDRN
jgi:hypothetical protein